MIASLVTFTILYAVFGIPERNKNNLKWAEFSFSWINEKNKQKIRKKTTWHWVKTMHVNRDTGRWKTRWSVLLYECTSWVSRTTTLNSRGSRMTKDGLCLPDRILQSVQNDGSSLERVRKRLKIIPFWVIWVSQTPGESRACNWLSAMRVYNFSERDQKSRNNHAPEKNSKYTMPRDACSEKLDPLFYGMREVILA